MRASILALAGHIALSAAVPSDHTISPRQAGATAYASNLDGSLKLSSVAAPVQGAGSPGPESTWNLSIDYTSPSYKQKITSFGAAVTNATATSFNTLSSNSLNSLLIELMTSAGAGFSLMRYTVGASDLSRGPAYTYDDNGGAADPNPKGFNLSDRGNTMVLSTLKQSNPNVEQYMTEFRTPSGS